MLEVKVLYSKLRVTQIAGYMGKKQTGNLFILEVFGAETNLQNSTQSV
jgi:hypothetical protein